MDEGEKAELWGRDGFPTLDIYGLGKGAALLLTMYIHHHRSFINKMIEYLDYLIPVKRQYSVSG